MSKLTVILTRTQRSSREFADDLRIASVAFDVQIFPMFETTYHSPKISLQNTDALIFTSANGVNAFCDSQKQRDVIAYCVGPQTERVAKRNGFKTVSGNGNIDSLLRLLKNQKYLYIRGELISHDLVNLRPDLTISESVFYSQSTLPAPNALHEVLRKETCILPIFSLASAKHLLSEISQNALKQSIGVTISEAVSECLTEHFGHIFTAKAPNRAEMINTLIKISKNPSLVAQD